jgi:hypothetical protein
VDVAAGVRSRGRLGAGADRSRPVRLPLRFLLVLMRLPFVVANGIPRGVTGSFGLAASRAASASASLPSRTLKVP